MSVGRMRASLLRSPTPIRSRSNGSRIASEGRQPHQWRGRLPVSLASVPTTHHSLQGHPASDAPRSQVPHSRHASTLISHYVILLSIRSHDASTIDRYDTASPIGRICTPLYSGELKTNELSHHRLCYSYIALRSQAPPPPPPPPQRCRRRHYRAATKAKRA